MSRRVFARLKPKDLEAEIEEELSFHLELLKQEHFAAGLSPELAKAQALGRFGDLAEIKNACVAISKRNCPLMRALKAILILVFMSGLSLIALSTDFDVRHVGQLLVVLPILARFLIYVRGVTPSRLQGTSSPLMLIEGARTAPANLDHRLLTLVERVRSDS